MSPERQYQVHARRGCQVFGHQGRRRRPSRRMANREGPAPADGGARPVWKCCH